MKPQIINVDIKNNKESTISCVILTEYEDSIRGVVQCSPEVYFFCRNTIGKLRFDYSAPLADGIPKVKQILSLS